MNFEILIALLRRWWWLLLVVALISGGTAFWYTSQSPPTYEATTRLLVGPVSADLNTQRAAGQLALTYAELVRSQSVVQATIEDLSLGLSPSALADSIRTSANSATRVLTVSLDSPDPERAAAIVNALADNLIAFATTDESRAEGRLTVLDRAQPGNQVAGRAGVYGTIAAFAGLLAALALAAVLEYLDNGIRSGAQLVRVTGLPLLTTVQPRRRWMGLRSPEPIVDPTSEEGFQLELLSAKIEFAAGPQSAARSIVFLPIDPRGGSGWLALNVAIAFGLRGRTTALVDADPVAEVSALAYRKGRRQSGLGPRIPRNVHLSRRPADELEQLSVERAREAVTAILNEYDVALLYAAPAQAVPNSIVWTGAADAVVLVVRVGDPAPAVSALVDTLRLIGAPLAGVVYVHGTRIQAPSVVPTDQPDALEEAVPQG